MYCGYIRHSVLFQNSIFTKPSLPAYFFSPKNTQSTQISYEFYKVFNKYCVFLQMLGFFWLVTHLPDGGLAQSLEYILKTTEKHNIHWTACNWQRTLYVEAISLLIFRGKNKRGDSERIPGPNYFISLT